MKKFSVISPAVFAAVSVQSHAAGAPRDDAPHLCVHRTKIAERVQKEMLALKEAAACFPGRHVKVTMASEGEYLVHELDRNLKVIAANIARITLYADGSVVFAENAHVSLPELTVLTLKELSV